MGRQVAGREGLSPGLSLIVKPGLGAPSVTQSLTFLSTLRHQSTGVGGGGASAVLGRVASPESLAEVKASLSKAHAVPASLTPGSGEGPGHTCFRLAPGGNRVESVEQRTVPHRPSPSTLQAQDDPVSTFSEENLIQVVTDLFLGGTDTTATTLHWALIYMVQHGAIQGEGVLGSTPSRAEWPHCR